MKKFIVVLLAVALTACASPVPTEQAVVAPPEPSATPVVVVQTVVVEATQVPTDVPPPTEVPPTEVPPTAAPVVVTVVVEATQPVAPQPTAESNNGNLITVENALGAGWFVNMTRTGNNLSLRCQLYKQITFTVTPTDPNIKFVDFYYRTQDRSTGAVFEWQNAGRMIPDANGNFTIVFSGEDVNANFRKPLAWFDYQFIGSNPTGVVGRSEKIVQQVDYTNDCP